MAVDLAPVDDQAARRVVGVAARPAVALDAVVAILRARRAMRINYGRALYKDDGATLDDLREAVNTLEDLSPYARRVFGGEHPLTAKVECYLPNARAALRAREEETPSGGA